MIQYSKQADERREAGSTECWCLHGAVGMAADWRGFAKTLAPLHLGTRAVDLWRFLEPGPMPLPMFGDTLNAEAAEESRSVSRYLLGYSMGGRLALHSLLGKDPPWKGAVIISAHPGLEDPAEQQARRASDSQMATRALAGNWQQFISDWDAQPILAAAPIRDSQASRNLISRRREIARSFVDWSLGAQEPLWNRLSHIQIPVLWVAGEHDPKFLQLAGQAVESMPNATLAIAPGSGHRVPWEAEEWLARQVARFFQTGGA